MKALDRIPNYKDKKTSRPSLGISPLVAAVLLIAVTMTIAALLTYWATGFVKTSLPETNETEAQCRFASFSIYSCTYYNSTDVVNIILENYKNIELRNLKAFLIFPNATASAPITLDGALPAGGVLKSYQIQNIEDDFSKIMITTHCPDVREEKVCTRA